MNIPVILVLADKSLNQRFVSTTFERSKLIVKRDLGINLFVSKLEYNPGYVGLDNNQIFKKLSEEYGVEPGLTILVKDHPTGVGGSTFAPCSYKYGGRIIINLCSKLNRRTNGLALTHEIGHALGALHVEDRSIMSSVLPIKKLQGFSEVSRAQIKKCLGL